MQQATVLTPLALHGIEQGQFIAELEKAFIEASAQAVKFVKVHGDRATKSKTTLTAKVELTCLDSEMELFEISTHIKTVPPTTPARVTKAIGGDTQDDRLALFAKSGGSSYDDPEQGQFADQKGEPIG